MKKSILIDDVGWLLSYLDVQSIRKVKALIEKILDDQELEITINHESLKGEYVR